MKITQKQRRPLSKAISSFLKQTYFEDIPLDGLFKIFKEHGFLVIQEDGEEWQGILCGHEGTALFRFAEDGEQCDNAGLALQWYKMQSGKWEVTGYLS